MSDIRDIHGIGPKKANELKKHYNIRTVYTLRKYVRKIPDIITDVQRVGLRYHDKINKTIKRADAEKHVTFMCKHAPSLIVAGSIRRKAPRIGDIDVLTTKPLAKIVAKLIEKKYIVAVLSQGDEKFSGIARLPGTTNYRKIDIMKTTAEEKPFALLYFTGDFVQNIVMRQKAKKMKFRLSQHGMCNIKTGKFVKSIRSEKDIFKFLKMEYVPPEKRNHKGHEAQILKKLA